MESGKFNVIRGGDDLDDTHIVRDDTLQSWASEIGWTKEEYFKWLTDWIDMPDQVKKQIFGSPPDINFMQSGNPSGKVTLLKWQGDLVSVVNSLGLCMMATNYSRALGPTHFAELFSAYMGCEVTATEIMETGERIFNLLKSYSVREGFTRKHDDWPARFYTDEWPSGKLKGSIASKEKIEALLDDFYKLRGWDIITGTPTRAKLIELGLNEIAEDLSALGYIS